MADIFPPDDHRCAAIHNEVGPLVDKLDAVKGRLGEEGSEGQHPDEGDTEHGKWIFLDNLNGFLHIY
jgi:hypothetical protein